VRLLFCLRLRTPNFQAGMFFSVRAQSLAPFSSVLSAPSVRTLFLFLKDIPD